MVKRLFGVAAAAAAASAPIAAQTQSCDDLRAQLNANAGETLGIAYDYPRTHTAIVACMVGNEREDEALACAAVIVVTACIGMGSADCNDLVSRWQRASQSYQRITARMRALGCAR